MTGNLRGGAPQLWGACGGWPLPDIGGAPEHTASPTMQNPEYVPVYDIMGNIASRSPSLLCILFTFHKVSAKRVSERAQDSTSM